MAPRSAQPPFDSALGAPQNRRTLLVAEAVEGCQNQGFAQSRRQGVNSLLELFQVFSRSQSLVRLTLRASECERSVIAFLNRIGELLPAV